MSRESRWVWLILLSPFVAVYIYERFTHGDDLHWALAREEAAKEDRRSDLQVAVVWPRATSRPDADGGVPAFVDGARLAMAEINAGGGVFLVDDNGQQYARKLALRFFDERNEDDADPIARRIARDPEILAVVGNRFDKSVIPASIIYDNSAVLFVAPTSTDPALTMHNMEFVFRTAPRDRDVASAMVNVVAPLVRQKRVHVALLYPQVLASKVNGREVADLLTEQANTILESYGDKIDFRVVVTREYERGQQNFDAVIRPLLEARDLFNVVLIADVLPDALNLRLALENSFEQLPSKPGGMEPQVLDLTGLQWERADAYYLDFTPETSKNFFTVAAQLVLWETKQKAIVLASRDDIGRRLGSELNNRIVNTWDSPLKRLSIDLFRIYDPKAADSPKTTASPKTPTFAALVAEVLETPADFIFVAGGEQGSPELIEQLREAGAEQPIICGWDLESELLRPHETRLSEAVRETLDQWLEAEADQPEKPTLGQIVDRLRREMGYDGPLSAVRWYVSERRGKTYVASTFNPYGRGLPVEAFQDRYRRAFGGGENGSAVVDANAVFGYFAVQLVRQAFERGGTASPKGAAVSLKLAASDDWILGNTHFSPSGDLLGLQIVFKQMDPDGTLSLISLPPQPVFAELAGPSLDMIPGAK